LSHFYALSRILSCPPECASLCARCFNWALATRRARTRKTKRDVHPSGAEQRPCHAMQIISLTLTRRDCAQRPIKRFYCSAVCLWPLVSIVCLPLGDKTREENHATASAVCLSVCAHQIIAEQTDNLAATTPVLQARPQIKMFRPAELGPGPSEAILKC
jgi:hypothetical protein